jgi:hypothetical protein
MKTDKLISKSSSYMFFKLSPRHLYHVKNGQYNVLASNLKVE